MSFLIGYVEVPSFVLGITTRSKSINKSSHLYTAPPKRSPLAWIKREPYKIRDKSLSCQRDWEAHEPKAPSPEVEPQTNILFTALYVGGSRDSSNLTQAVVTEDCPLPPIVFSLMATKPPVSKKVKKITPEYLVCTAVTRHLTGTDLWATWAPHSHPSFTVPHLSLKYMAHLTQVTATWDMEGEDLYILLQENKTKQFFFSRGAGPAHNALGIAVPLSILWRQTVT